jgi:predicted KAP-like P-loop ATPase
VIAADDAMIKHAVRRHFGDVDDELVTNYFDKLIQLPIRVPPLGTQEVHHAYYKFCRVHQTLRVTPAMEEWKPTSQIMFGVWRNWRDY